MWTILAAGAAFLLVQAFLHAPCWSVLFVVAAMAWPIWHEQREYAQFRRRAVLAAVTIEDSSLRRWLWSGHWSGAWQAVVALGWAIMVLAFGTLLHPAQWGVVVADAVLLALLIAPVQRRLAGQVRSERQGLVARRWPLLVLNVAALALAFLILDFFLIGAPDTRGAAWRVVTENAFAEASARASCQYVGWLVGALAAVDRGTWHATEVLIPTLPGMQLKLAAWAVVLLQAGVFAFAVTRFLLGVVALVERRAAGCDDASSKPFFLTVLLLAVLTLFAAFMFRDFDPAALATGARRAVAWSNPCRADDAAFGAVRSGLAAEIEGGRVAARKHARDRMGGELDALFGDVERQVDDYLDWYFSVLGEYQRLAALATGTFAERMRGELEQRLFAGIQFDDRLERVNRTIGDETIGQLSTMATRVGMQMKSEVEVSPCRLERMNPVAFAKLDRDLQRAGAAVGAGVLVGAVATRVLARTAVTAVAGRVASKKVFQVAAALPARMAARRGGSIVLSAAGGTALCAPLGPFAALCGVGAGVVAWLALDQAFVKIDEVLFRAEMRAELLDAVGRQKAALSAGMQAMHDAAIEAVVSGVRQTVDGAFIPVRDGL